MSDFTIEQLEALKEGTTPGPWEVKSSVIVWNPVPQDQASLIPEFLRLIEVILSTSSEGKATDLPNDAELAAASPALLDQLIAREKELQRLRKSLELMRMDWTHKADDSASARDNAEQPARAAHARHLKAHQHVIRRISQILEGNLDG